MDQPISTPKAPDSTPAFTLTVEQLRELIREEIQRAGTSHQEADRLLDIKEAAKLISMSEDWLYRHSKQLPFARKVGRKRLRFSEQGIVKWMATRKLS